jgi:hypothetical protein
VACVPDSRTTEPVDLQPAWRVAPDKRLESRPPSRCWEGSSPWPVTGWLHSQARVHPAASRGHHIGSVHRAGCYSFVCWEARRPGLQLTGQRFGTTTHACSLFAGATGEERKKKKNEVTHMQPHTDRHPMMPHPHPAAAAVAVAVAAQRKIKRLDNYAKLSTSQCTVPHVLSTPVPSWWRGDPPPTSPPSLFPLWYI